jgi:ribosomal protein S27E
MSKEIKLRVNGTDAVAVCTSCGTEQTHFSKIMINTMRSNKDIIFSDAESHIPFGFPCSHCKKTTELVYDRKEKKARCSTCNTEANVSPYTMRSLEVTGHVKRAAENTEAYEGETKDESKPGIKRKNK